MSKKCIVYISLFPFDTECLDIFPAERGREIAECKSAKVRDEKFYGWKLLELAIKEVFAKNISDINLKKVGDKWLCDDFYFSLSHSGNLVAVAVSEESVGIDLEKVDFERFAELKIDKLLTPKEKEKYNSLDANARPKFLNVSWSKKEAIFKKLGGTIFTPNKIDTLSENVFVQEVCSSGENYYVVIAGDVKFVHYNYLGGVSLLGD